jgi:hypothetical protein
VTWRAGLFLAVLVLTVSLFVLGPSQPTAAHV